MRPTGEVRIVILDALRAQGAMPLHDLAERTHVGLDAARRTVDNAVRSGSLEIVGHEKREHCKKWVALYDVAERGGNADHQPHDGGLMVLENFMNTWR